MSNYDIKFQLDMSLLCLDKITIGTSLIYYIDIELKRLLLTVSQFYYRNGYLSAEKNFKAGDIDVDLKGRSFMITGANSGIGLMTSTAIAQRGRLPHTYNHVIFLCLITMFCPV